MYGNEETWNEEWNWLLPGLYSTLLVSLEEGKGGGERMKFYTVEGHARLVPPSIYMLRVLYYNDGIKGRA